MTTLLAKPGSALNRHWFRAIAIILAGYLSSDGLQAATTNIVADADSELREGSPATVITGTPLIAGSLGSSAGNEVRRALLHFDLSAIPQGAVVTLVELDVQVIKVPLSAPSSTFELRRLLVPWSENQASWNNRLTSVAWSSPGAIDASDTVALPSSTAVIGDLGSYTFPTTSQLVADVQDWVDAPANNHGWLFRTQSEEVERTARHFGSRESAVTSERPRLTVHYAIRPVLNNVVRDGDGVGFQFLAETGVTYRIEARETLTNGNWEVRRRVGPFGSSQTRTEREPVPSGASNVFVQVVAE